MKHKQPIETGPVTADRWQRMTLPQQLGAVGSEFSMYTLLLKKEAFIDAGKSLNEVLRLIDLTISDSRWLNRVKDLTRFRKILCDTTQGQSVHQASVEKLQDYLLSFALLERK
ncbi:MAG: hypothetical protein A2751_04885 [Candidatus Doudnabacteria bacterium RIFCSPHIGHO2_01_FULL_46_14]|uniref:Uncharacterized protein n=1 Tax=Candidatus Doudnabacteria bacterium RIFCSPHIGHO2_01_FULL_46_14 TaxID=1817824 RepID=A0A1F5NNU2_9BACT|nr:MAG: hypothetical protein A2751_04885 [Candidatus Doudnabacteria bacterium RIFCSPHIGHO2_01_FULL_46_14]